MTNILKKAGLGILIITLTGTMLVGCNSSSKKIDQSTPTKTVTENNELDKNNSSEMINKTEQKDEKADVTIEPEKLKEELSDSLGDGESIKDIAVKDKHILIKVDLGTETNGLPLRDLAETRYAGLSEKLLPGQYWAQITVEFIGVGSISMDTKDAVNGQYFKGIDINKMFKN